MLLTISTTHQPTTDLGYLLHKHPDKFQSINLSIGKAHIFYPEFNDTKATICLLLDIDPIDLVRRNASSLTGKNFTLGQYVNDRPYVASSFMSVALSKAFSTAMNGTCKNKPGLVDTPFPIVVEIVALPVPKGGEALIRKLFEPLGYQIEVTRYWLDDQFKDWGASKYYSVILSNTITVKTLLRHLYVLIPALDNDKHYYVSKTEIDKLLDKGEGWLIDHPARQEIVHRYLLHYRSLSKQVFEAMEGDDDHQIKKSLPKAPQESLHQKRLQAVFDQLKQTKASKVLDLGCGEGKLLQLLLREPFFKKITGVDVTFSALLKAKQRLKWEELAPHQKERIDLLHGALTYRDERLKGYDAAAVVEVIEHLDEDRLKAFEHVLFGFTQPQTIVITTPNREYNVKFENMTADSLRHLDHRFEWTRAEFQNWAATVCKKYGYSFDIHPIGEAETQIGAPSQMGVFHKN